LIVVVVVVVDWVWRWNWRRTTINNDNEQTWESKGHLFLHVGYYFFLWWNFEGFGFENI